MKFKMKPKFGIKSILFLIFILNMNNAAARPDILKIIKITESEVFVQWTPLSNLPKKVEKYQVVATPIHTYSHQPVNTMEWMAHNGTTKADLIGLQPGSNYNICLEVLPPDIFTPVCQQAWTLVGGPDIPSPVEVLENLGSTVKVQLHQGFSDNGPITGYQVVVVSKSSITTFQPDQLSNITHAQSQGISFYIAASLPPQEDLTFIVGDGKTYGGFFNAPLDPELEYDFLQGSVSFLNNNMKVTYSSLTNANIVPLYLPDTMGDSTLKIILATAIGIITFFLLISFIIYFLLRRKFGKRRPSDEMVLGLHNPDAEESCLDITEDCFDRLKERAPKIPREIVKLESVILGQGQFGEMHQASIYRNAHTFQAMVNLIQDPKHMSEKERHSFFIQFDAMLRLGKHANVLEFLGISEEKESIYMIFEHWPSSLRGLLLRSRQNRDGLMTNLSEIFLFDTMIAVALAMATLAEHKIVHGSLSSRNVLMADGGVPKLGNFGLIHFDPLGKKLDLTRWRALECNNGIQNTKTDVWAFGVLLWEMCTLGGTPYVDMSGPDIAPRLLCGYRLPQPKGVSEELYQLMLHCWEFDPDERPNFSELAHVLHSISLTPKEHIAVGQLQSSKFDPSSDLLKS